MNDRRKTGGCMAAYDHINPDASKKIAAQHERRLKLAALPYPANVSAVVQLQRMAVPILKKGHIPV